jgi:iron complex transport system permease protein
LTLAVVALFLGCVLLGDYTVTLPDFFRILGGEQIPGATFIVMESKLPKAVAAVCAGLAFGLSGALFQTLLRNPLASPDIIGINVGASAAAVVGLVVFGLSGWWVSAASVLGGLACAGAVYALSMRGRSTAQAGGRLILTGIGLAAMLQALITSLLTHAAVRDTQQALVWLSGSLNRVSWDRLAILAAALVVVLPAVDLAARQLRMLQLGDDLASALGVRVTSARLLVILLAVLLSAMATAVTGPIAFVAFLAGPLSRILMRGSRLSLAAAALTGAVIVLGAQFVSGVLIPSLALPVGIITGMLGAPALIALLLRSRRTTRSSQENS